MEKEQLTLNFTAGLSSVYGSCRELIHARIYQQGRQLKAMAADMDLSPSHLSRKLAQSPNDSMKFTLDDFESYLEKSSDVAPLEYYIDKYLRTAQADELAKLKERIAELEQQR